MTRMGTDKEQSHDLDLMVSPAAWILSTTRPTQYDSLMLCFGERKEDLPRHGCMEDVMSEHTGAVSWLGRSAGSVISRLA